MIWRGDGGPGRRGSGYRVSERHVMTSAHVVEGAATVVQVRCDADRPGEWVAATRVAFASRSADLALLELVDLPPAARRRVPLPWFGSIPESDATVRVSAVGFPLFKMREAPTAGVDGELTRYRDSCHVDGKVSVLSNRREGSLEVAVRPPAAEGVGPLRSPWEGMSGASVWWENSIIGVIALHHRADGLNRLAAVRVSRWYEALGPDELELMHSCAGLPIVEPDDRDVRLRALPRDFLSRLSAAELWQVTDAIVALPALRGPHGLDAVLDDADPLLVAQRPRDNRLRSEVHGLLLTCRRYPDTFSSVLDALRNWERGSEEVRQVERMLRRLALKYG
ncbi:trypsin-like peptidase domain-containing protein [Streptomyces sp. NPDC021056]|uniref:effector-associated domain 2-containing protein n=1 Tax=Streptomyces sp. NPDC021056 TaxID=3155012 RepID=UPI0033CA16EB